MSTTEVASPAAITEIRAVVDVANQHQNDPDRLPLHTEDIRIVNVAGVRVFGRDALGQAMRRELPIAAQVRGR